jgi:hypothetical protein
MKERRKIFNYKKIQINEIVNINYEKNEKSSH